MVEQLSHPPDRLLPLLWRLIKLIWRYARFVYSAFFGCVALIALLELKILGFAIAALLAWFVFPVRPKKFRPTLLVILAGLLSSTPVDAHAQVPSPTSLQILLWGQAQQFLSDCSIYTSDTSAQRACYGSRAQFENTYYQALTGDAEQVFAVAYLFAKSPPPSAVVQSEIHSCAWMIVFDDMGGAPSAGPQEPKVAAGCRKISEAFSESQDIEQEMINIRLYGHP